MTAPPRSRSELETALAACLSRDRHPLRQLWFGLGERRKVGKPDDRQQAEFGERLAASQAAVSARRQALPQPTFDDALPVNQKRDELLAAIRDHQVIIVCGETGSGKTTQLPKLCLQLGRGSHGLIGHTQPRRLAARSVASRIAQELATPLGSVVGYKVRFTDKTSASGYVKLMTDGILLTESQSDRYLSQYDTLIVDEAHERSLNIDFLLGFLKQLLPKRPDLKVIITSATIDADRFSKHFSGAPVLEVSGRTYPVEVRYRPLQQKDEDDREQEMESAVVDAVEEVWRQQGPGDVLVFLPGEREIRDTAEELRKAKLMGAEVLPLFARLSADDQQRIFKPSNGRRIVLSTNVAETSLTVPGIRYVIDSGLARINRYSPRGKVEQLLVEKISQASARQRAGRCGRVAAGVCVRLYSEDDFNARQPFTDPEIVRSSLAAVILRMQALRLGSVEDFPFLEAPNSRLIADGYQLLHELGAVDEQRSLTALGKELSRLPVDPRIGRMLLAGKQENCLSEMLILASALSIQDPRDRPFDARDAADRAQLRFQDDKSDFVSRLKLWWFFDEAIKHKKSNRQLIELCHSHFLSYLRLREWRELHGQLASIVADLDYHPNEKPAEYQQLHRALLTGLLGNIGMKSTDSDEYLGARGIKFHIFPGSGLKKARPKWAIAAELVDTGKLYARCVANIEPDWVESLAPHLVNRQYFDPHWEQNAGQVVASERVTLYGLPIVPRRKVHYGSINPGEAHTLFLQALAAQEVNCNAPFYRHNRELIAEVQELEHKARRQDVLVDDSALAAFYGERIPADIVNFIGFDAWRKGIEKTEPKRLFLSKELLMQHAASHITEAQFPVNLALDGHSLALGYRFELGHPLDGVTVSLPLHLLNRIQPARFDWLVPGLLREKLTLLLKSLPKPLRRLCVPVPEFATKALVELERSDHNAPLLPQLALAATRLTGQPFQTEDFSAADLPAHLRMNFCIVDAAGQELASGRDLVKLQQQLGEAAQLTFREQASHGRSDNVAGIERDQIRQWDFGDLPSSLSFQRGGGQLTGYPALTPADDACAIRLFDTAAAAAAAHRKGVVTLLGFELKEQLKQLPKALPGFNQLALQMRSLSNSDELLADLIRCITDRAFIGDDDLPRRAKDFACQKDRAKARLPAVRDAALRILGEVTAEYLALQPLLAKASPLQNELKDQLGQLVYAGYLSATPWEQLPHLPRYLKAMRLRLEKYPGGPARDQQRGAEVAALWQRWRSELERWRKAGRDSSALEAFRWQIEELRVSLFAQELRTPYPVSLKRLDKVWQELLRQ